MMSDKEKNKNNKFYEDVKRMRHFQKRYSVTGSEYLLDELNKIYLEIDKELNKYFDSQMNIF